MGKLTYYYMIAAAILATLVIFGMNIANTYGLMPAKYISQNEVKNVAVEHKGKMYTLNFEQQKKVIDILNRLILVSAGELDKVKHEVPGGISKIVIYKFSGEDIDVKPVGYVGNDTKEEPIITMVFSIPQWNKSTLLEESFPNEMMRALAHTFDEK